MVDTESDVETSERENEVLRKIGVESHLYND